MTNSEDYSFRPHDSIMLTFSLPVPCWFLLNLCIVFPFGSCSFCMFPLSVPIIFVFLHFFRICCAFLVGFVSDLFPCHPDNSFNRRHKLELSQLGLCQTRSLGARFSHHRTTFIELFWVRYQCFNCPVQVWSTQCWLNSVVIPCCLLSKNYLSARVLWRLLSRASCGWHQLVWSGVVRIYLRTIHLRPRRSRTGARKA